jgi:hypothetical protein
MPSREPTAIQVRKAEQFRGHPLRADAVRLACAVIEVAGLDPDGQGRAWGVTLCPDRNCVIRVNVGNQAIADLRSDGRAYLMMILDGKKPRLPRTAEMFKGFEATPGSILVVVDVSDCDHVLATRECREAIQRHALASGYRDLPNSNWDNPLSSAVLEC